MNKDYVRTTSRPPRKRKPTGRSGSAQPTRAPFPVIRAVLAVALVIGFGVFLYLLKGQGNDAAEDTKPKAMAKPIPIEEQRPAKEKFDYMTLLENKEVNVDLPSGATPTDLSIDPEQQKKLLAQQQLLEQQRLKVQQQSGAPTLDGAQPAQGTGTTSTPTPKLSESQRAAALLAGQVVPFASLQQSKPGNAAPVAEAKPVTSTASRGFMLQCGAFRGADQAESMKLRLNQQGHGAQVQRGQTATGSWYKVILGPFASRAEAESRRSALQSRSQVQGCTIFSR